MTAGFSRGKEVMSPHFFHGLHLLNGEAQHICICMHNAVIVDLLPAHHAAKLMGPSGVWGLMPEHIPLLLGVHNGMEVGMASFVFLYLLAAEGVVEPLFNR